MRSQRYNIKIFRFSTPQKLHLHGFLQHLDFTFEFVTKMRTTILVGDSN